jgi:phospholipase C
MPLIVISPWAKQNYVDHTLTDQSSILKFVEDNWRVPKIAGSADAVAGTINHLFDFNGRQGDNRKLYLDPVTGQSLQG